MIKVFVKSKLVKVYLGVPLELELRGAGLSHRGTAGCGILGGHLEDVIIIIS